MKFCRQCFKVFGDFNNKQLIKVKARLFSRIFQRCISGTEIVQKHCLIKASYCTKGSVGIDDILGFKTSNSPFDDRRIVAEASENVYVVQPFSPTGKYFFYFNFTSNQRVILLFFVRTQY